MKITRTALAALSCVSLLALAACATGPAPSADLTGGPTSAIEPGQAGSSYGLFLAGTEAFNSGDKRAAADFFADASHQEGGAPFLEERAFIAALVGGDVHRAAQLAPGPDAGSPAIERLGRLTRAVDALADGKGREAQALLVNPPLGEPFATAGLLLAPWAAAAAGDWKSALALPPRSDERLTNELALLDNALLLERHRRYADADAAFHKLLAGAGTSGVYTASYGAFLERRGRRADAVALYQAALKADSGAEALTESLARVQAGKPAPPAPTISQGAAQALLGPAVVLLAEKEAEPGLYYLRLVLRLDPGRDEGWVLVGDAMVSAEDTQGAREAYNHPKPGSPEFIDARARLIATYDDIPADNPMVLQIAQDTVKAAPSSDDALILLADADRLNEHYAESAKVLDQVIADQAAKAGWQLYYMRGVALQQEGDWPAAEADMQKALALSPDEPDVLNYLGYSWVDRGERLAQAKLMIEKAVAAKPDSGAIVDSLGWVYFRMGDFAAAVEQLERAAQLEPADPDINNHLGDAYWRAGRKTEARFQWQRVLGLGPDAKLRAEVERKMKSGLDGDNRVAEAAALPAP